MIRFDPKALAAPLAKVVDAYQIASQSPAVVARVSGPNQSAVDAAGVSDLKTGRLAGPEQSFEIGSQTKMMTATIILQLVGEGKINLDAAAGTYLDAATKNGIANIDTATMRNLLNMKSGIEDYTVVPGSTEGIPAFIQSVLDNPSELFDATDALALVRGLPSLAAPGTSYSYSNTNYMLLGQIIEQVTGKTFTDNLQERIFTPAGMTHSTTDEQPSDANRLHQYLTGLDGKVVDVTDANWRKGAEGGVVSTTEDMTKFIRALLIDKTLLSPPLLAEMTERNNVDIGSPEVPSTFGLGISSFFIAGIGSVTGFTGGTLGTDSSTYADLTTGRIISVGITNPDGNSPLLARDLWLATKSGPWGQITFNPASDVVQIAHASAADAKIKSTDHIELGFGAASLTLPGEIGQLTTKNLIFSDGSVLVIGNNMLGAAGDDRGNTIDITRQFAAAIDKDNQILGLGGNDWLTGGRGDDKISGGSGRDHIWGGAGHDRLNGGDGADVMDGGAARDVMRGGEGRDVFDFNLVAETGLSASTRDRIADFQHGFDHIDLKTIDANANIHCDQAFKFIGTQGFHGVAGELHYVTSNKAGSVYDTTILEGDVNGDGRADFQIELTSLIALSKGDFVL